MNIQSSNINLNLPAALNNANRGRPLNSSETATKSSADHSQSSSTSSTVNAPEKSAAIEALNNIDQNSQLSRVSKENTPPSQSIQTYLDNANLANQPQRDELQLLLGIDIFV